MTAWPFDPIAMFSADVLVIDPPWRFELYSAAGEAKSAQAHYACMSLADIKALPVGHLVGCHSWLFLWATAPMLPQALDVMQAWGFEYRTRLAWRKVTPAGKPRLGTGYVVRSIHEDVLVGAIGSLFEGVAREHSRKPDAFYRLVEDFAPNARRVELFGRETRAGWASWGSERTKFDMPAAEVVAA